MLPPAQSFLLPLTWYQHPVAEIDRFESYADEIQGVWRMESERFIRSAEAGFVQDLGYARVVRNGAGKSLEKRGAAHALERAAAG